MKYLFVLTLIALSVVVGFILTYWDSENTQDGIDTPKAKNPTTKRCPSCGEEIESDMLRCKRCGSFVDFFRKKP